MRAVHNADEDEGHVDLLTIEMVILLEIFWSLRIRLLEFKRKKKNLHGRQVVNVGSCPEEEMGER